MVMRNVDFPTSRAFRKQRLRNIKSGDFVSKIKVPGHGYMNVYRIPLKFLSYNPYNTRFIAQAKTLEKRFGCKLSDENREHVDAIEKFIWNEKKDQNKHTINSLIKDGQLQAGVVTIDGVILSGNRRFRLLNEITRNADDYVTKSNNIAGLEYFEAVILDEEELTEEQIIKYESFYQFGIEDKVDYNPIQKYIAAYEQNLRGFSHKQIAENFYSITRGDYKLIQKWLEVYDLMENYLVYIGEEGVFTALDGREEAFLSLYSTLKAFRTGKAGKSIWAFDTFDLDNLKLIFYDFIRLNVPTHDFRIFKDVFSDKNHWENFVEGMDNIFDSQDNALESFEDYRAKLPNSDEIDVSKYRQKDYIAKYGKDLKRLYGMQNARVINDKTQELPLDILKSIVRKLDKLENEMRSNTGNEVFKSEDFISEVRLIQKRIGKIKQKVD